MGELLVHRFKVHRTTRLRAAAVAIVAAVILGLQPAALAATTTTEGLGSLNDASSSVSSLCAGDQALTGVRADLIYPPWATEGAVGRLAAVCGATEAAWIGGAGEAPDDEYTSCPDGQVATGIDGREGSVIDAIEVLCRTLDEDGLPSGAISRGGSAGGLGGGESADIICPAGQVAIGLSGLVGDYEIGHYAALVCESLSDDTTAPAVTVTKFDPFQRRPSFTVAWSGSDAGTGVKDFDLRRRSAPATAAFGEYEMVLNDTTQTTYRATDTVRGTTYCYWARGKDAAFNVSDWAAPWCTAVPLDDKDLTATGSWSNVEGTGYFGQSARSTTDQGSKLTFAGVQTKRIAVRALACPNCGVVKVRFAGNEVARFNLARSEKSLRYFVVPAFDQVRTGTVAVTAVSPDGKRVTIDAVGVRRVGKLP